MSGSSGTDEAVQRVKNAFDAAAEEAGELSEAAREEFQEAIDELETKVDRLRD